MVILNLTEKGGESKQLSFDKDEVVVGRVQGNDVVLGKGNVSKRHCRIFVKEGRFQVEDMKSTNGTYVNGRKIPETTPIFAGDKIYVGDFVIRVENAPSQETAASLANEAGSLSSALGSRRPPPPPARATGGMRTVDAPEPPPAPSAGGSEPRRPRPTMPPPPPPPRRDSRAMSSVPPPPPPPAEDPFAPPAPSDLDIDGEDVLATAPPRPTPPPPAARGAAPVFFPSEPPPAPDALPEEREPVSTGAVTATRDRNALPSQVVSNPGDPAAWIRTYLDNDAVTAVYVSGAQSVEIETGGRRDLVALGSAETAALANTLRGLAGAAAGHDGLIDTVLSDGTRLCAVLPPIASEPCATFIKRPRAGRSLGDMVSDGVLSREMREILEAAVSTRTNILVAGDPGATRTIAEGLANAIPSRLRVVGVGSPVAPPNEGYNWTNLALEPRNPSLVHTAAGLRPDHLLVDLGAAPVAADVLHECAYGLQGAIVTLAGRSSTDVLNRLAALAGTADTTSAVRDLVVSAFDVVIHAVSTADGRVLVLDVAEPRSDGRLHAEPLATFRIEGTSDGKPTGKFQVTGTACRLAQTFAQRGAQVSPAVLRR